MEACLVAVESIGKDRDDENMLYALIYDGTRELKEKEKIKDEIKGETVRLISLAPRPNGLGPLIAP
jgi:hypothetical protein